MKNTLFIAALLLLVSCSKDDDPVEITADMGQAQIEYNTDGVWARVASNTSFAVNYLQFNHEGEVGPYGLQWRGFTPARYVGLDYANISDWAGQPFQVPSKGGMAGERTPYIVACWNTQENASTPAEQRSCRITYAANALTPCMEFTPRQVYAQLTCYTLDVIRKTDADFKLIAHGVKEDGSEVSAEIYLAGEGNYADTWREFDLSALGTVKEIYFTIESNYQNEWSILVPPYFAIDRLQVKAVLP